MFCAYFYPRPPRGGRRISKMFTKWSSTFLSTPSARRATHFAQVPRMQRPHFYPRPPRGGRLCAWLLPCSTFSFLSTPSARRATAAGIYKNPKQRISIHALREEGDMEPEFTLHCSALFLSTPSARRATKPEGAKGLMRLNFYPRPPRGGRPAPGKGHHRRSDISIHALREEGDPKQ